MDRYQPFMTAPSLAPALLWKPPYIIVCHSDYGCQLNANACNYAYDGMLQNLDIQSPYLVHYWKFPPLGDPNYKLPLKYSDREGTYARGIILFRLLKPLSVRIRALWFLSCQKRSLGDLIRSRSLHYN